MKNLIKVDEVVLSNRRRVQGWCEVRLTLGKTMDALMFILIVSTNKVMEWLCIHSNKEPQATKRRVTNQGATLADTHVYKNSVLP